MEVAKAFMWAAAEAALADELPRFHTRLLALPAADSVRGIGNNHLVEDFVTCNKGLPGCHQAARQPHVFILPISRRFLGFPVAPFLPERMFGLGSCWEGRSTDRHIRRPTPSSRGNRGYPVVAAEITCAKSAPVDKIVSNLDTSYV